MIVNVSFKLSSKTEAGVTPGTLFTKLIIEDSSINIEADCELILKKMFHPRRVKILKINENEKELQGDASDI